MLEYEVDVREGVRVKGERGRPDVVDEDGDEDVVAVAVAVAVGAGVVGLIKGLREMAEKGDRRVRKRSCNQKTRGPHEQLRKQPAGTKRAEREWWPCSQRAIEARD
jgi:hypothetical protein